jgi:hypothetical protein
MHRNYLLIATALGEGGIGLLLLVWPPVPMTLLLALEQVSPEVLFFARIGKSHLIHADCFEWLGRAPENTFHAIVTDPPWGVKEYDFDQLEKRANGNGGVWRIPPSFDGPVRAPLPRFTALDGWERERLRRFSIEWGRLAAHAPRRDGTR